MKKLFYNMFDWAQIAVLRLRRAASVAMLMLAVFASLPVFAVSADTAWGDVKPTKTLGEVAKAAGLATTQDVRKAAADAVFAITNDFAANFTPLAAPIVTNLVEDILAPRTLEFHYSSDEGVSITNGLVAPVFATSKLVFVKEGEAGGVSGDYGRLYSAGKRRNYSILVESLPPDKGYMTCVFSPLAKTHTVYAQPKLYASAYEKDEDGSPAAYSWDIMTNDVPCVITVREPDDKTIIVRRDQLNQDE